MNKTEYIKIDQVYKLEKKNANFANFDPSFYVFNKSQFSPKTIQKRSVLNRDNMKFWKKINIYAFRDTHKINIYSWYEVRKNDDVTILRTAQLEHIS